MEAHGVEVPLEQEARAQLKKLHRDKLRRDAELARTTAAVEAAMAMDDPALLQSSIVQGEKAGVRTELLDAASRCGERRYL